MRGPVSSSKIELLIFNYIISTYPKSPLLHRTTTLLAFRLRYNKLKMSKRGVSAEEKRKRMLEIFYEKKDVFQLKELEKIGPKEKGIIMQSVKDVVQALVDDGYVDTEKIGTSVYFWAFPSKATQIRKRKLDELEEKLENTNQKKAEAENQVKRAKLSRQDDDGEREELIAKLADLKQEKTKLIELLAQYKDSDPDVIAQEKKDIKIALDAANRWTDNIFSVRTWLKSKFSVDEAIINKQFDIPETFDYIE